VIARGSERAAASVTSRRSPLAWRLTVPWFERFFRQHLNALRVARWGEPQLQPGGGPLVIYSNHPAWWDAALYILLAGKLLPGFESFAPIDAAMLTRYRFFGRIGAFGIDPGSRRGAVAFLAAAEEILSRPNRALLVTAQGRFVDARVRPVRLRSGIAALAKQAPHASFLPLAIEYTFWTERGAEALVAFGPPRAGAELAALPRAECLSLLEADLEAAMDRLAVDTMAREPGRFRQLVAGRAGIGGVYDAWRRLLAYREGRSFDPAHGGPAP
jgi:1-acyl-sn-glycerol-3-phosphate acyltransferase